MENTHPSNYYLLGDEGYLGKELHQQLKQMGYELWTPYRKNMTGAKKHNDHQLMAIRRTIVRLNQPFYSFLAVSDKSIANHLWGCHIWR